MRAFVAAWPPPGARAVLAALPRPELDGVRWVPEAQWHVTLAFLGELDDERAGDVAAALDGVVDRWDEQPEVVLGPATERLGHTVLVVGASGLEAAASDVRAALGGLAVGFDPTPYRGHLTLARCGRGVPEALVGIGIGSGPGGPSAWRAGGLSLVASVRDGGVLRYETLSTATVV